MENGSREAQEFAEANISFRGHRVIAENIMEFAPVLATKQCLKYISPILVERFRMLKRP